MLKAWDKFDQEKGSENDRPGKTIFPEKKHKQMSYLKVKFQNKCSGEYLGTNENFFICTDFFGKEQFFLILEFEFGGSDLENMNGKVCSCI